MAASGPGLSGAVEPDQQRPREDAGRTGERVSAADPHHVPGLVVTQAGTNMSVFTSQLLGRGGEARRGHASSQLHITLALEGADNKGKTSKIVVFGSSCRSGSRPQLDGT